LKNVLIIDNAIWSFAAHLQNGIPVVDFMGNQDDRELLKVMQYVHSVSKEDDLMAANERTFGF